MADRRAKQEREEQAAAWVWARLPDGADRAKPALSPTRIVLAALELADAEGVDALSMRGVAKRLGAGTMSLYRHVATRDDLIDLMVDEVVGAAPLPDRPSGDWRADLTTLARSTRRTVREHPWVAGYLSRPGLGPHSLARTEFALAAVAGLGLSTDRMLDLIGTVDAFTLGFVQDEWGRQEARRRAGLSEAGWREQQAAYLDRVVAAGDHPQLGRVGAGPADEPDERFARRLGYVLDGLAAALGHAGSRG
ncbi:TetR/AcrR family transcriptional regulator [Actinocatenispora comari]|jgi:AcrR family transcriptional regulator|uniref:TetR family transcriptional regulator n=1 Tax=Actinocatenispora comari TaxID=2807577 RepID=A0A8J4AH22_9ACTN|nr:TetR/AcrR family transcriptional regulator [Actinocatenispora comari]GIL30988.1 TetR family transcriptional regulator [Actinocatenispora comari]